MKNEPDNRETVGGSVKLRVQRVPDMGHDLFELVVPLDESVQALSNRIARERGETGEIRILIHGKIRAPLVSLHSLKLTNDDLIYYRVISGPQQTPLPPGVSPSNAVPGLLGGPMMQILAQNPECKPSRPRLPYIRPSLLLIRSVAMSLMRSSPQIQALRRNRPQLNAMFDDETVMREMLQTLANPGAAQELMKSADRAMSNIDTMPGGFDHLRRAYEDLNSSLSDTSERRVTDAPPKDYTSNDPEVLDQPFPHAWSDAQSTSLPESVLPQRLPLGPPSLPRSNYQSQGDSYFNGASILGLLNGSVATPVAEARQRDLTNQMTALREMGFRDEGMCRAVLEAVGGDLNAAIDELIRRGA